MRFGLNFQFLSPLLIILIFLDNVLSEVKDQDSVKNRDVLLRTIESRRDGIHKLLRALNGMDRTLGQQYENNICSDLCPNPLKCPEKDLCAPPTLPPKNPGKRESPPYMESYDNGINLMNKDDCNANLPGDCVGEGLGDDLHLPDHNPGKRSIHCKLFGIGCESNSIRKKRDSKLTEKVK